VSVSDTPGGLVVQVTDQGPAAGPAIDDVSAGLLDDDDGAANGFTGVDRLLDALVDPDVALAVVTGLVDDVDVDHAEAGGTVVTMRWPLPDVSQRPGATQVAAS
jgi:anti-sigma regulatory factor (Ser/Thr protein kinase)